MVEALLQGGLAQIIMEVQELWFRLGIGHKLTGVLGLFLAGLPAVLGCIGRPEAPHAGPSVGLCLGWVPVLGGKEAAPAGVLLEDQFDDV